ALAGCSTDAPPPPPPPPVPTAPQATILDDPLRAIEKAKSVEGTVQESKDRADAALEEAEGG
ncbi:MAG: hypothetical protein H7125_00495, partial [Proteobacteria bacterium]|nr:hypothetical protein [Burkholderiales bacterium]